ncbi:MAG: recombinase family protein [Anaerostipes sp.]|nr:recombinase family protein [Anaerostipes sp.]
MAKSNEAAIPVAAYIRVSTHQQEELSPDAQRRLLKEYAKKNDMILTNDFIFMDGGISGRTADKRPAFLKMIEQAKAKRFKAILVWKFSRFARNQEESIVYKSMLRNKCDVDVVSITENIQDNIYGGLIERIIEWMDEFYSIRLGEDVTRGMTENAMRGNYQASPPFGYTIEHTGEEPVIVPEQAEVIRWLYNSYISSSIGFYELSKELNRKGIKTKRGKNFEARGIKYILQNPTYKGYTRWNYRDKDSNQKDPEEWIIRKGKFEPIISEELWNQVNNKINSTYAPRKSKPMSQKRHWLSGIIKCSSCGRSLSTSVHKDSRYGRTYINFQCYGYLKGKCLDNHQVSEKKIVPTILEMLKDDMSNDYIEYEYINTSEYIDLTSVLLEKLKQIDTKEQRIKDAFREGIDTIEEYKENKQIILDEKHKLELELSREQKNIARSKTKITKKDMQNRIRGLYDIVSSDNYSIEQKQAAVRSVIKKIVFDREKNTVDIYYYYS